jgi:hypothetical protein
MFQVITTGALALSLLGSPILTLPPSQTTPPAGAIIVDLVTVNGTGCPAGTAAVAVSADNTAFTVTYSAYTAMVGVGALPTDLRKNCLLSIRVNVPAGFTYAIAQVDYRGFGHLEAGASGTERANYYFQGSSVTPYLAHTWPGPLDDNWQGTDKVDIAALVYAPCGELRNLNINTELRVAAGTSDTKTTTSFMTMDSTDAAISTIYHFAWAKCQ